MRIPVSCTAVAMVDPGMKTTVCAELADHLARAYPDHVFEMTEQVDGGPSLAIRIQNASSQALGLIFVWTTAAGQTIESERLSKSVMDRDMTADMRNSLYRRIIAASPMPK